MRLKTFLTHIDCKNQPEVIQTLITSSYARVKRLVINRVDRTVEISLMTKAHQEPAARELTKNEIRDQLNRAGLTGTTPNQETHTTGGGAQKERNFCDWCYISNRYWSVLHKDKSYRECSDSRSAHGSCEPCRQLNRPCTFTPTATLEAAPSMWADAASKPRIEQLQSVPSIAFADIQDNGLTRC